MTTSTFCQADAEPLCYFERGHCPLHGVETPLPLPEAPEASLRDIAGHPAADEKGFPLNLDTPLLAENVVKRLVFGHLSPARGLRLLRAVEALHRIGPSEQTTREHAEMAWLMGLLVNGLPPITRRHWEMARELLEPGTFEYLRHWDPRVPWEQNDAKDFFKTPTFAKHGIPGSVDYWGERAFPIWEYNEPPDHEVPEFFNPYLPEYERIRARQPGEAPWPRPEERSH